MTPEQLTKARKIAAISAPGIGIALLVARIDAQAAEIDDISALRTVLRESDWAFESHQYSTEWQYMASCDRISRIVAHIDAQAAEIELLYDALEMAVRRNKVAKQLMNDEQIEHCCKLLRAAK